MNNMDCLTTFENGYVDSRGVGMGEMSFSTALAIVREMSLDALPDLSDVQTMPGLQQTADHGLSAILTVDKLLIETSFLESLEPSAAAAQWPDDVILAEGLSNDPLNTADALRIVLSMASTAAQDPASAQSISEAEDMDWEQACMDMVSDLLGMHATVLSAWKPVSICR